MVKRKSSEIGTARAHIGAPHNQPFNVTAKPGKKKKAWWNGHRPSSKRSED